MLALVRKELIRPDRAQVAAEDAFRFRHLLVRDAAYQSMPKQTRAELHERFAVWLEGHAGEMSELDEILGYHLEQAVRYRRELGMPADDTLQAAARARLTAAGRRASIRGDYRAGMTLLERAAALVPDGEIDTELEYDLVDAASHLDLHVATKRAMSFVEHAMAIADERAARCARVLAATLALHGGGAGGKTAHELTRLSNDLLRAAESANDRFGLYVAQVGLALAHHMRAEFDLQARAADRGMAEARGLGRPGLEIALLPSAGSSRLFGSTPIKEVLAWCDEQEVRGLRHGSLAGNRAFALAYAGRFDEARTIVANVRREFAERGADVIFALMTSVAAEIEQAASDWQAAARFGEEGCRLLEEVGDRGWLCTCYAKLGEAYYELGSLDEAEDAAARSAELGTPDDVTNEQQWRELRAKVLARRGEAEESERLARETLALYQEGNAVGNAFTLFSVAQVRELNGDLAQAAQDYAMARDAFERKGFAPMADRCRERLNRLGEASRPDSHGQPACPEPAQTAGSAFRRQTIRRGSGTRLCGCRCGSCRPRRRTAEPGPPGPFRWWPACARRWPCRRRSLGSVSTTF